MKFFNRSCAVTTTKHGITYALLMAAGAGLFTAGQYLCYLHCLNNSNPQTPSADNFTAPVSFATPSAVGAEKEFEVNPIITGVGAAAGFVIGVVSEVLNAKCKVFDAPKAGENDRDIETSPLTVGNNNLVF